MSDKRKDIRIIGGAVGLLLLSRLAGLARESIVVGFLGVHDFTDAYFSISTLVLWVQNWAFGALSLYLVPKLLAMGQEPRLQWFESAVRRFAVSACVIASVFFLAYAQIERTMLAGKNVLGGFSALLLAGCIPVTAVSGLFYGKVISTQAGIVGSARALLLGNLSGIAVLVACVLAPIDRSTVLPLSLFVTQAATLVLLIQESRRLESGGSLQPRQGASAGSSQVMATTVENVGFNANAIAQQAIAGALPTGAVTLNAYATRLVLIPLTGIFQPIQQRLLIHFSRSDQGEALRAVRTTIACGCFFSLGAGALLGGAALAVGPWLPSTWQVLFSEHQMPWVLALYGVYSGVVFMNQALARFLFGRGAGWLYAGTLLAAYTIGTGAKVFLAPAVGILGLPLGAVLAEGLAALLLGAWVTLRTAPSQVLPTPTNVTPSEAV